VETLKKKDGLVSRALDNESAILNVENGYIHVLNSTGSEVWELLDTCSTMEEVIAEMKSRYKDQIAEDVLASDIKDLIDAFLNHGLLVGESTETE
jgi:hypothetical protein